MEDDGEEIMSAYHKIEMVYGSPVVMRCPYNRWENAFGWIDNGGYLKCNGRYCADDSVLMQCSTFHGCKRDCITDRIERSEWGEYLMKEFEEDFCCPNEGEHAEMMECYDILKRNKCMISGKTHDHAEKLKKKEEQLEEVVLPSDDVVVLYGKEVWESLCERFNEDDDDDGDDNPCKNSNCVCTKANFLLKKFLKTRTDLIDDFLDWIRGPDGAFWQGETPDIQKSADEVMSEDM